MNRKTLAFIGGGNMAEALAHGVLRAGLFRASQLRVSDVNALRLKSFKAKFKIAGFRDNASAARGADIVVLAVKPAVVTAVLADLKSALARDALVVSIAAGIRTALIESRLERGARVVRVMPNTGARVGLGAAAFCLGRRATPADARRVARIFQAVGIAVRVREADLDAVTALSGSGPAYVFFLAECMQAAGARMGLARPVARELTVATVAGAARLLAETGLEAGELRRRVTSPGGTTEAAFKVLRRQQVRRAFMAALRRARRRSQELSQR